MGHFLQLSTWDKINVFFHICKLFCTGSTSVFKIESILRSHITDLRIE